MGDVGRRGAEPDPSAALNQVEFRGCLKELIRWAGYTSLQQLAAGAKRRGVDMPVSTAHRALNTERLPTADFVKRFVVACSGNVAQWIAARDLLADQDYARRPPVVDSEPSPERNSKVVYACPYPGLAAFGTDQAGWFFGRKRATVEVVSRLTERLEGTGPLVVFGPSGAGKSSLLRAGLVSALDEERLPGSRSWPLLLFTPGPDPVRELATRVAELAGTETGTVVEELVADPTRLADILRSVPAVTPDGQPPEVARVVLVVDQFEETFTLCADEQRRRTFIQALCAISTRAEGRPPVALVVLGLRADFYGHCAAHPGLVDALRPGQVLLGAMDATELRDAIEKPAHAVGMEVQPGLVEVILADLGVEDSAAAGRAGYDPGALPLLSHALLATWQQRDGAALTLKGYRLTGGIRGAVAITAEQAYQQLDPHGQRTARQLLLRMVMLDEGVEDTRRKLGRVQLVGEAADPIVAEAVLDALARARLVTLDAVSVEIAHEAVLRAWPRLREWIDTDRAGLLIQQRLVEAVAAWEGEGRHLAGLYQGPRLAAVRDWAGTARPDLSPLAGEFLAASVQREHDEQRATRRRTRRLRQLVAGLGVMLLLAATTTVFAIQARNEAVHGRNEGISRKAADKAIALRTTDPALAAQLSLAAFRLARTAEAYGALISSLVTPNPTHLTIGTDTDAVRSAAFSPKGDILATGGHDNASHLWGVTNSLNLGDLAVLPGHADAVRSVAFHPAGNVLATASSDRTAKLWDVTDPSHPRELAIVPGHLDGVFGVAFSPTGNVLATASSDRTVKLWDVTDPSHPRELATLTRHAGFVLSVAFSRDGRVLATASSDTTVGLWDITDPSHPEELPPLAGHTAPVYGLAFSPDGHTLATASVDTTVRLWDVTDPLLPGVLATPLVGHTDNVYSVAFSPDRHTLVTASHDKTVRLWETDPDRIAVRICDATHTVITRTEWDYYFPGLPYRPPCS